jgi:hypothetical protein
MVDDEVKGTHKVPVGPIHKLIAENTKSNSLVMKVNSKFWDSCNSSEFDEITVTLIFW